MQLLGIRTHFGIVHSRSDQDQFPVLPFLGEYFRSAQETRYIFCPLIKTADMQECFCMILDGKWFDFSRNVCYCFMIFVLILMGFAGAWAARNWNRSAKR